jgi:uncharacterized tellurite resistance protein B-like protein
MFEKLRDIFFTQEGGQTAAETSRRIQVATAVILLEVANSDDEFTDAERKSIVEILKDNFDLGNEEVQELISVSDEKRKGSIDIWHFANVINENYSDGEKYTIMENIWKVIYSDGRLDKYEDHVVHKLATILHIPHKKMIEAKLKYMPEE